MWEEKWRPPLHLFKSSFFWHPDTKKYQNFPFNGFGRRTDQRLIGLKREEPFQPVCRDSVSLNGPWTCPRPPPSMVLSGVKQHGDGMKSRVKSVTFHHILREKHASCLCVFVDYLLGEMCLVCSACLFVLVRACVRVCVRVCVFLYHKNILKLLRLFVTEP